MTKKRRAKSRRKVDSRLYLQIFLIIAFFIIATNTQSGWLFLMISLMIATLAINAVMPYLMTRNLLVTVSAPSSGSAEEVTEVKFTFKNRGRVPLILTGIRLNIYGREIENYLSYLGRGEELVEKYQIVPRYRGIYKELSYSLKSSAPFGLFSFFGTRKDQKIAIDSIIFPAKYNLSSMPIRPSGSADLNEGNRRMRTSTGQEYFGSREYQSDDSYKYINWKATAKAGKLMVKEFEDIAREPISIIIDPDLALLNNLPEIRPGLEEMIKIAVTLAQACNRENYPFDLASAGSVNNILERPTMREVLYWGAAYEFQKRTMSFESIRLLSTEKINRQRCFLILNSLKGQDFGVFAEFINSKRSSTAIIIDSKTFFEDAAEDADTIESDNPVDIANDICMNAVQVEELRKMLTSCNVHPLIFKKGDDLAECLLERSKYIER